MPSPMPILTIEVKAQLTWRAFRDVQGDAWIAVCDALRLTTSGDTFEEMAESLGDVVSSLLAGLLKEGSLDAFLRGHGWSTEQPVPKGDGQVRFSVPYELLIDQGKDIANAYPAGAFH